MPTIIGILTYNSMINKFMQEMSTVFSILVFMTNFHFSRSFEWTWKKLYNLRTRKISKLNTELQILKKRNMLYV